MLGAVAIGAGLVAVLAGVALVMNVRGVGERVATFGGSVTFLFDGGQTLRRRQRAYRTWGVILLVGGIVAVAIGIAALT